VVLAVFVLVVVLGYAVPWGWTGFTGNTLWDWFGLLFLPLSLGKWRWTGFTGNTLWDWMNLSPLPLLLPTVILRRCRRNGTRSCAS
jgi:hypothetical protein